MSLLKFIPFVAIPAIGGYLFISFENSKSESDTSLDNSVSLNLKTLGSVKNIAPATSTDPSVPKFSSSSEKLQVEARGFSDQISEDEGDNKCRIYVVDTGRYEDTPLHIKDRTKYYDLDYLRRKQGMDGSLVNRIKCSSDRYFLIYKNLENKWILKQGNYDLQ